MYSCRVKGKKTANFLLPIALQLPSAGLIIVVLIMDGPVLFVVIGSLVLSGMALFLSLRAQLTEFVYEINDAECPGQYDLIISSVCGKRIRTECRMQLCGKVTALKEKADGNRKTVRMCQLIPERRAYVFEPEEFKDEWNIIFCPDDEMLRIMQALGTEVNKE